MKITYNQIISSVPSFRELQALKFPPKVSLEVYKLGKELDREIEAYRSEMKKIYENHDVPQTEEGFDLKALSSEQFEVVAKDLQELLDSEGEIKNYHIPLEVFERYELPISTNLLIQLDWLIKPEGEEKVEPAVEE